MHTTPASLRLRQSPPAASTPAPGPHTRSAGPLAQTCSRVGWPDHSGAFSVTDRAAISCADLSERSLAVHLSLAASGHRMSLFMLLPPRGRRHNAAASSGMLQPLITEGRSAPLSVHLWPQVRPSTVVPNSSPSLLLSRTWGRCFFPWLSPVPAASHSASRTPRPHFGQTSCLFSTYARTPWRPAQVCQ